MLHNTFLTMLEISLAITLVIALVLSLSPLMKKYYIARLRYMVWLILAIRLLIPFHLTLPKTPVTISIPQTTASQAYMASTPQAEPAVSNPVSVNTAVTSETPKTAPSLSPIDYAFLLWASGVIIFAVWQLLGYFSMKKRIRRWGMECEHPATADLYSQVKYEMGIKKNIRLLICKKTNSPMMFGFLKTAVLLPKEEYDEEDLRLILRHELIHYQHRDLWYKLILIIANAVHWFNPLVYLMTKAANRDIENFCDEELVKNTDMDYRKKYSETLLAAIHTGFSGNTALSTYFYGGKKTMKERFQSILSIGEKRRGVLIVCVVLTAAILAGVFIGIGNKNTPAAASASNTESSVETPSSLPVVSHAPDSSEISTVGEQNKFTEGTGTVIKNDECNVEIKLPDSWQGRYLFDQFKNNNIVFSYDFYNKTNYDLDKKINGSTGGGIGRIFEIFAYANKDAINPVNKQEIIGQNDQYTFYIDTPSDVQYYEIGMDGPYASEYENAEKDYKEMFADIQGIVEDFLNRNNITVSAEETIVSKKISGYDVQVLYNDKRFSRNEQDKANQLAIDYILALSNKNWDIIKAKSTEEFYTGVKSFNANPSSDTSSKFYSANQLVGKKIDSIIQAHYYVSNGYPYEYVSISINDATLECEVKLAQDNNGNYIVSGFAC